MSYYVIVNAAQAKNAWEHATADILMEVGTWAEIEKVLQAPSGLRGLNAAQLAQVKAALEDPAVASVYFDGQLFGLIVKISDDLLSTYLHFPPVAESEKGRR